MTLHDSLSTLTGSWTGTTRLWLRPDMPASESVTMAEVATIAGGSALSMAYDWDEDGPQDGLLVIGEDGDDGRPGSTWIDSFHTAGKLMPLQSTLNHDGTADLLGSYAAPPGPDWGWRIVIEPGESSGFVVRMANITPDGEEYPAVESVYTRLSPLD